MKLTGEQIRAFALLGFTMLFWSGNFIVGRVIAGDMPPLLFSLLRWSGALILIAPFAVSHLKNDKAELFGSWKIVLALGLIGVAAFNSILYTGLQFTTASNAALLQAGTPAVVLLLDRVIFKLRSTWLQVLAMIFSIMGVIVITFQGDLAAISRFDLGLGEVIVLLSMLVWSLYTVLLKLRPKVSPTSLVAATFIVGTIAMIPLAAWEWSLGARVNWNWKVMAALAYVSVFPSIAAFFMYNSATKTLGAMRAGQAITLLPLLGAFLAALILGEALYSYHAIGMVLIVVGIGLSAAALRTISKEQKPAGVAD